MKGDFTRDTFDPAKHFSRVLMQQGRVQLDADWNEQASILLHYLQTLATDLIGPHAGPVEHYGFEIIPDDQTFSIGAGRYYVNGILCENESKCKFSKQPDYPLSNEQGENFKKDGSYGVYLDVWERHITHLDDSLLREVALGGPDTATRAKVVWQVKVMPEITTCDGLLTKLLNTASNGHMQAQVKSESVNPDPCITSPDSKYRGVENQLYRVEIHEGSLDAQGNPKEWSFKWSRENGSVVAAWLDTNEDGGLMVSSTRGLEAGQWVEVTSETDELLNVPGKLIKIVKVEGDSLYFDPPPEWNKDTLLKIRRWDQNEVGDIKMVEGAVMGAGDQWLDLEDGVQVWFEPNKNYYSGDYWLIPARVATGQIEWPLDETGQPALLPPRGIEHHYAPLAVLTWNAAGELTKSDECRDAFTTLSDITRKLVGK